MIESLNEQSHETLRKHKFAAKLGAWSAGVEAQRPLGAKT